MNRLSRYQKTQQLFQQFWSRWSRDDLTQLQQRRKWQTTCADPKIGDLVILKEDNIPPLRWPMARIVEVHPVADKVTRVVSVKVSSGNVFRRSMNKVCFSPM
ncbi:hypothetical protein JTB14_004221 [Gonioctena quinquepunctata]|nr:hypothetical protein JTB14_004221 [Gonioctena quinquepunctata]